MLTGRNVKTLKMPETEQLRVICSRNSNLTAKYNSLYWEMNIHLLYRFWSGWLFAFLQISKGIESTIKVVSISLNFATIIFLIFSIYRNNFLFLQLNTLLPIIPFNFEFERYLKS